jgi:hypothetical protein
MRWIAMALVLASTPAEACHHFSRWFYKTPQRCAVALARPVKLPLRRIVVAPPLAPFALPTEIWSPAPEAEGDDRIRLILIGGTR